MSDAQARPRWFFLVTPRWLGWHLFTVVAVVGMLWLGDWQLRRAEAGNALSWAYTFEWPIFAIMGVAFWAKTIIDELKPATGNEGEPEELNLPAGAARPPGAAVASARANADGDADAAEEDDPELDDYNAYLARLNQQVQGHGRWHGLR
ncbi:MAG: hypothetical protein ACLPUO_12310 [Streptosporangiaceae bacterium]|jgi:hypothetical protein